MAATETDSETEKRPRLINGRFMTCPRCEKPFDILAFQRMEDSAKYAHELAPIYKCPRRLGGCGFFFAPTEHAVVKSINPQGIPEELRYE